MARMKEEREQRRLEAKQRAEKRKAAKEAAKLNGTGNGIEGGSGDKTNAKLSATDIHNKCKQNTEHNATLPALSLPIDALAKIMRYLPAREYGAMSLVCTGFNHVLGGCRVAHISSRLMRRVDEEGKQSACGSMCLVGGLQLCSGRKEAQVSIEDYFISCAQDVTASHNVYIIIYHALQRLGHIG